MEVLSTLVSGLAIKNGPGVTVPELVMPTLSIPARLQDVNVVVFVDTRNKIGSLALTGAINQGASSAAATFSMASLDRGLWRLSGELHSTNFVGPAASSASPLCCRIALYNPQQTAAHYLAITFLQPGVPQRSGFFTFTFHLDQPGWILALESFVATGVGESIGAYAPVYIEQLI